MTRQKITPETVPSTEQSAVADTVDKTKGLAQALANFTILGTTNSANPWSPNDIDKMEAPNLKEYRKVVDACRFFYKRDPLASVVVNKMVDIGINDLVYNRNGISDNEFSVYEAIEEDLLEFAESMALEYLISGLVLPEVKYAPVTKDQLKFLGIKRYDNLTLPVSMWVRDPNTIVVNQTILSDKPSFLLEIPKDLIFFVQNNGKYSDGNTDIRLYEELKAYYPDFFNAIMDGKTTYPIENQYAIRRRVISGSCYPVPYLYPAIEPMKHKRNLRRMDYSVASRVISAIQLIKLGSDVFPITEADQDQFADIRQQMLWRDNTGRDVERIFQLFANHTLNITWVVPPVDALLNDAKYKDINEDIIFAMGFPRILLTGETAKSNTSDAQFASVSPIKTMESFRHKIEVVLQGIMRNIADRNKFKNVPDVSFEPLQLIEFKTFSDSVAKLYASGNLSRESYADIFGFSWVDEMEKKVAEQDVLLSSKLPEFAPQAFSPQAGPVGGDQTAKPNSNPNAPPKPVAKPAAPPAKASVEE